MFSLTVRHMLQKISHQLIIRSREHTVWTLMLELQLIWDILPEHQILVFEGKLMHDKFVDLSHYGVKDSDLIELHVKLPYRLIVLAVECYYGLRLLDTKAEVFIGDLKFLIDNHIGVPPHRQRLEYMGAVMEDHDRLLDYVITSSPIISLIELQREGMLFNIRVVNMNDGYYEMMEVDEMDTLCTVAAEMRRRGLNRGRDFYFVRFGRGLSMNSVLGHIGIHGEAIVEMHYYIRRSRF